MRTVKRSVKSSGCEGSSLTRNEGQRDMLVEVKEQNFDPEVLMGQSEITQCEVFAFCSFLRDKLSGPWGERGSEEGVIFRVYGDPKCHRYFWYNKRERQSRARFREEVQSHALWIVNIG